MSQPPKYGTKRNPENPTFGGRVAKVAEFMGTPFMPWQRLVSDVAFELDPARPGEWRYPLVVVSVPRQSGKTAWLRAVMADRMMNYNRHEIMMTAQNGKFARKRWAQIGTALGVEKHPEYFRLRMAQGSERLEYPRRGSYISPFAPTPKSIHGDSLHLVTIDEAWAFDTDSGTALEAAINPTQLTILDSQLIIVSTKGTATSEYLNKLIERGRMAVNDPLSRMAYFEYSADEEAADRAPYSDETLAFHPAIGYTQTAQKIRDLNADGGLGNWRRNYLNLETATSSAIMEIALWDTQAALKKYRIPSDLSKVSLGVDVAVDRSAATIYACWKTQDGYYLKTVKNAQGIGWVAHALPTLTAQPYGAIIMDDAGPARTIINDLDDDVKNRLTVLKPYEYGTACQLFLDRVNAGEVVHDNQENTRDGIAHAVLRPVGAVSGFDIRKSAGNIDALRAATFALYGTKIQPEAVQVFI